MADFALVMVPHVDDDRVRGLGEGVELGRGHVLAAVRHIEGAVIEAVGDNLVSDLDDELEETAVIPFDGHVEPNALQPVDGLQGIPEGVELFRGQAELGIDAFAADVDATQDTQWLPDREEVVPQKGRIGHVGIPVETERRPVTAVLLQFALEGLAIQSVVQRAFHSHKNTAGTGEGVGRLWDSLALEVWTRAKNRILSAGYAFRKRDSHHSMKMLEYCQRILAKVSFDRHLFSKELSKSIQRLEQHDLPRLRQWCMEQFGKRYGDIIAVAFPPQLA